MQAFTLLIGLTILLFVDLWLYAAVFDGDTSWTVGWIAWANVGVGLLLLGLTLRETRQQFRRRAPLRWGFLTGGALLILALLVGFLVLARYHAIGG